MTDLRGYGDSSKPPDGENHANYSKRAMALDQIEVMQRARLRSLRRRRSRSRRARHVAAGGRASGGRDACCGARHRAAAVFDGDARVRDAVLPLVLPDPAGAVSGDAHRQQRGVLPAVTLLRLTARHSAITPEAIAEYLRCFKHPATIHATCEDYRAGATIDLDHSDETGEEGDVPAARALGRTRDGWPSVRRDEDLARPCGRTSRGQALPGRSFPAGGAPDETVRGISSVSLRGQSSRLRRQAISSSLTRWPMPG